MINNHLLFFGTFVGTIQKQIRILQIKFSIPEIQRYPKKAIFGEYK